MSSEDLFNHLINEALAQEFSGWDFSYLKGRWESGSLPWDYRATVELYKSQSSAMLDMGTGGGEFLSSLAPLPAFTCATEGYPPNIEVARRRLSPLGVEVAAIESGDEPLLPFADQMFDLIINRHESYRVDELHRILQPGGCFITQQVGSENCIGINQALQEIPSMPYASFKLESEMDQFRKAGFQIKQASEAFPPLAFYDIGALVFYLKVITWQVHNFSVERYRDQLLNIHQHIEQHGKFVVSEHRFFILALRD